jgi:hypothetical protein
MICAYPRHASVMPGATLTLHVSTDSTRFRVAFYRWGDGPVLAWRTEWLPGRHAEDGAADQDWDWPAYGFDIPPDWPSAVYIAEFEEKDRKRVFDLARDHGAALFVVRSPPASSGKLLYKLPLATYHAYNAAAAPVTTTSHRAPAIRPARARPCAGPAAASAARSGARPTITTPPRRASPSHTGMRASSAG